MRSRVRPVIDVTGTPSDRLVVAWIRHHARVDALADALGASVLLMPWARAGQPLTRTARGWTHSAIVTWRTLRKLPPGSLVLVQAPPVFAVMVAWAASRRRSLRLVADLHSGALNDPRWRWSFGLMRFLLRRCQAVTVTNRALVDGVDLGGVPLVVLHDPLSDRVERRAEVRGGARPYVVFPAAGAFDEPVEALAGAAALLSNEVDVVMTGDVDARRPSQYLRRTGYLPSDEYRRLLAGSAAVLALTTRDATMQQAAYEALELRRPLVCSSTRALREVLDGAAVFVANEPEAIAEGVRRAIARNDDLVSGAEVVVARLRTEVSAGIDALLQLPLRRRSRGAKLRPTSKPGRSAVGTSDSADSTLGPPGP